MKMTNVLRHNTFSKLSQASKGFVTTLFQNCRKLPIVLKKCVAPQKKWKRNPNCFGKVCCVKLSFETVDKRRNSFESRVHFANCSFMFRKSLWLRRQTMKYVAKLRRFLKQLELVDSFKKSLSAAPMRSLYVTHKNLYYSFLLC